MPLQVGGRCRALPEHVGQSRNVLKASDSRLSLSLLAYCGRCVPFLALGDCALPALVVVISVGIKPPACQPGDLLGFGSSDKVRASAMRAAMNAQLAAEIRVRKRAMLVSMKAFGEGCGFGGGAKLGRW